MDTYVVGRGRHRGYATVEFERVLCAPVAQRGNAGPDAGADLPPPLFNENMQGSGNSWKSMRSASRSETVPLIISALIIGALFAVALSVCARMDIQPEAPVVQTIPPTPAATEAPVAEPTAPAIHSAAARLFVSSEKLPPPPIVTADSYLLVDLDSGEILAEHDSERRVAIASLTKIATAVAVLSLTTPDQIVEITPEAADIIPNRMGLWAGERLSVEQLLYGLLLDSGNDAAYALGDGVGGVDLLVAKMNSIAKQLGLRDTRFANPAGFDDPDNYSTARDLFALTIFALDSEPLIRKIVATRRKIIESSEQHGWYAPANLNRLLSEYPGTFGVKPGWTGDAGYALVAGARRNGRTLFAIVLGAEKHFTDASSLLDFGFSVYNSRPAPRG